MEEQRGTEGGPRGPYGPTRRVVLDLPEDLSVRIESLRRHFVQNGQADNGTEGLIREMLADILNIWEDDHDAQCPEEGDCEACKTS